jgi:hypothetical protein
MPVNYEIKGILAKLLATEDIIIEHKKVSTACFNVHTRVLTLPMWKASNNVIDLLCAHEVGHSRETPNIDWMEEHKIPQQFVNIVEDARVEKLMKRKYAGLAKTFYNGYKELHEDDFFQIADEDVSIMNLADRTNLYFKVGNFIPLDFNPEEMEIVNLIAATETFADALVAAKELYNYCKKEKEKEQQDNSQETQGDSQSPANEILESNDSLQIRKKVVITLNQSNHPMNLMVELLREIKFLKVLISRRTQKFAQLIVWKVKLKTL